MFFVTVILLILAAVFFVWGYRTRSRETMYLAVCFLFAALGTGVIEFFALSAF